MLRSFRSTQLLRKSLFSSSTRKLSYPSHVVVNMPSLSPTMESGSIAKWNLKEGDRFEPGTSLCDVETDKATVSFDATEEGYIAKILIASGDIKVGQPLLVTVEDAKDVAAFANFQLTNVASAAPKAVSSPAPAAAAAVASSASASAPVAAAAAPVTSAAAKGGRIFASPLAKKLVKDAGEDLARVASVVSQGSGPNGRIVAADVREALKKPLPAAVSASASASAGVATPAQSKTATPVSLPVIDGVYEDFIVSETHQSLATRLQQSKQNVPHYYLSVELNLTSLLALRDQLNANLAGKSKGSDNDVDTSKQIAVMDLLVKACAHAMRVVPEVNASWMETFVRQYTQVDINVNMSNGVNPVLRDVGRLGVSEIATRLAKWEANPDSLTGPDLAEGTFTVHNLGMFGVKSAAPIILPPQAAAVAFGSVVDTIVPNPNFNSSNSNKNNSTDSNNNNNNNFNNNSSNKEWTVAPVMTCTISCDHRVVDGAVSAQWLAALKNIVENPINLMM